MSNKGKRRYRRLQAKHREYFEALAREVVRNRRATVDVGVGVFDARLRRGNRWLDFREPNGAWDNNTNIAGLDGDSLVSAVTDELITKAAEFPGVTIPPPHRG